jgi:hypothetical protein
MNRIPGLAYGGNSLLDKFNGTGDYRPAPKEKTIAELSRERFDMWNNLFIKIQRGEVSEVFWNKIGKNVTVLRYRPNKGNPEVFYDGCKVAVHPSELEPAK